MDLHQKYGLTPIINAWGKATPYGVSRLPLEVSEAMATAGLDFFSITQLQDLAGKLIGAWSGAESGCVVNCTAAAITIAAAACLCGEDMKNVAGMPNFYEERCFVIQAGHCVNYGHPIIQALRLTGARLEVIGNDQQTNREQLENALQEHRVAAVVAVESHLTRGQNIPLADLISISHIHEVPVLVDGAAQDLRLNQLIETGADVVMVSAQKYLRGPTAGIMAGKRSLIRAARLQEKGIGRGMKTSKEALLGVCAAIELRMNQNHEAWVEARQNRNRLFVEQLADQEGVTIIEIPDPNGNPFSRLALEPAVMPAKTLYDALAEQGIIAAPHRLTQNQILWELVEIDPEEIERITLTIKAILSNLN